MAGSTTKAGLPYPTGTDRVADGDNAMQALAERLDGTVGALASVPYAVAAGRVTVTIAAGEFTQFAAVTFPAGRFSQPPIVHATSNNPAYFAAYLNITAAGGQIHARHFQATVGAASVVVDWVAVQMTSAAASG